MRADKRGADNMPGYNDAERSEFSNVLKELEDALGQLDKLGSKVLAAHLSLVVEEVRVIASA